MSGPVLWDFPTGAPQEGQGKIRRGQEASDTRCPEALRRRLSQGTKEHASDEGDRARHPAYSSRVGQGHRPLRPAIVRRPEGKIVKESSISFKWKDFRPTGGQLALDAGVPIDQVSQSMRQASIVTTERYYCRARAESAFAHVNEAYNRIFLHEPAIGAEDD